MIENDLVTYMRTELDSSYKINWGKVASETDYKAGDLSISFFKLPSQSSRITPSYLDSFQISVRSGYIDSTQKAVNEVIELFHLYFGLIGSYRVTVDDIFSNGVGSESEDIMHGPLTMRLKYTQL